MNLTPEELRRKIEEAQARQNQSAGSPKGVNGQTSMSRALRAATDLVAAVAVGVFMGYWIDRWLDTKPFGMIIMLFLGFAAGLLSIYKTHMGQELRVGLKKKDKDAAEEE